MRARRRRGPQRWLPEIVRRGRRPRAARDPGGAACCFGLSAGRHVGRLLRQAQSDRGRVRRTRPGRARERGLVRPGACGPSPTGVGSATMTSRLLRLAGAAVVALTCTAGVSAAPSSPAPGAPGALSHFDLARKDCLGTAPTTTSPALHTITRWVPSDTY